MDFQRPWQLLGALEWAGVQKGYGQKLWSSRSRLHSSALNENTPGDLRGNCRKTMGCA